MFKIFYYILVTLVLVVAIVFAVDNYQDVPIHWLMLRAEWPLSIILFGAFLLGLVLGIMLDAYKLWRQRGRIRHLEKTLTAAETELRDLRKSPLQDLS